MPSLKMPPEKKKAGPKAGSRVLGQSVSAQLPDSPNGLGLPGGLEFWSVAERSLA